MLYIWIISNAINFCFIYIVSLYSCFDDDDSITKENGHNWIIAGVITYYMRFVLGCMFSVFVCILNVTNSLDSLPIDGLVRVIAHHVAYTTCIACVLIRFYLLFQKSDSENCNGVNASDKIPKETKKYLTSNAPTTMPGHTGYLTFATLPPLFARGLLNTTVDDQIDATE